MAHNIEVLLKNNSIPYKAEIGFPDLYDKDPRCRLRYDFGIIDDNSIIRLIEFDGIQHFIEMWGNRGSEDSLKDRRLRDRKKNEYAFSHNIPLVRIPYLKRNNITLDMILGDEFLMTPDSEASYYENIR